MIALVRELFTFSHCKSANNMHPQRPRRIIYRPTTGSSSGTSNQHHTYPQMRLVAHSTPNHIPPRIFLLALPCCSCITTVRHPPTARTQHFYRPRTFLLAAPPCISTSKPEAPACSSLLQAAPSCWPKSREGCGAGGRLTSAESIGSGLEHFVTSVPESRR
jgi:hypothetical protein